MLTLSLKGNAFLHHMVRNIVGTLVEVGRGARPAQWVADVLAGRDRTLAGRTFPAQGLCLTAVDYPEPFACVPE
jgi:tRNA pseudouridine38-40 synthase